MRAMAIRLAALAIGLFVAILFAELLLRVFRLAPQGVATVTTRQFQAVPGIFTPGQEVTEGANPRLRHRVSINQLGYRGPSVDRDKAPEEYRIFFAGDSFTYGDFVDDEDTLPWQTERWLRQRCPDMRTVNGGLGGTTIRDQVPMIERAMPLDPDAVVLVFSENDYTDFAGTSMWDLLAQNREAKSGFPLSVVYPVASRTALWNLALGVRGAIRARAQAEAAELDERQEKAGDVDDYGASAARAEAEAEFRERYRDELRDLRDALATRGIPLVFVIFPSHFTVDGSEPDERVRYSERMGREKGVPTVNLLEPLQASGLPTTTLYLLPHDGHPAAEGYTVAAERLAERLFEKETVAASCGL